MDKRNKLLIYMAAAHMLLSMIPEKEKERHLEKELAMG
jgi:hypothetical protein